MKEAASGFAMPYPLKAPLGSRAIVGMLLLLFIAVTSTVSSSATAVSGVISFDVHRTYINPKPTGGQVVQVNPP